MRKKKFLLLAIAFCLVTAFLFGIVPSKAQSPCNDCQYRSKTAGCLTIDLSGAFDGTGNIIAKFEGGAQVKCKSGTGSCTEILCSR
jgi:hypothetical protein